MELDFVSFICNSKCVFDAQSDSTPAILLRYVLGTFLKNGRRGTKIKGPTMGVIFRKNRPTWEGFIDIRILFKNARRQFLSLNSTPGRVNHSPSQGRVITVGDGDNKRGCKNKRTNGTITQPLWGGWSAAGKMLIQSPTSGADQSVRWTRLQVVVKRLGRCTGGLCHESISFVPISSIQTGPF